MIVDVEPCQFRPLLGTKAGQFSADLNRREELSDRLGALLRCGSCIDVADRMVRSTVNISWFC
jgi:hypothetical protein